MPSATLLLRAPATTSLTSIVEKSQRNLPPFAEYDLRINSSHLDLVLISCPPVCDLKLPTDEGFESDIDTVSIVSSDDSFTSGNARESLKGQETDSANGSASSDSDTETVIAKPPPVVTTSSNESHNLVNCVCYTDIKFPHLLVFVIKCDALVFKFENLTILKSFYTNFSTFKAIANQKTYNSASTKYNLLQRTDRNGITHIEITKELETRLSFPRKSENSNIISLNTPDFKSSHHVTSNLKESRSYLKNVNLRQRSESPQNDIHSHENSHRSSSIENILNTQSLSNDNNLKKVWKSAEDLLGDTPKRPERRKKKQKAPEPPKPNILTGQFVRVDVKQSRFQTMTQKILPIKDVYPAQKKVPEWTYSVPRFLRRPRSQSETRNFTPIDYGYVDFTQNVYYGGRKSEAVSNRLFGMSSKLKDFNTIASKTIGRKYDWENRLETRKGSLGELSYKLNTNGGSLKSVIKKDDNKRKNNEKKVTFSAYTTVQVV